MRAKSMGLVWIVVKNLKQAVTFYTEVIGLKLTEMNEQWGWAELEGYEGGTKLGIAQQRIENIDHIQPGQNAVVTFNVDNLDKAIEDLLKQEATLIGKIEEIPGHVRLQSVRDTEGNCLQLVESLSREEFVYDEHMSSCCNH